MSEGISEENQKTLDNSGEMNIEAGGYTPPEAEDPMAKWQRKNSEAAFDRAQKDVYGENPPPKKEVEPLTNHQKHLNRTRGGRLPNAKDNEKRF